MGNGAVIAGVFVLSLFFSTFFISYFDLGFNGSTEMHPYSLPNNLNSYFGAQNYQTGAFNNSVNKIDGLGNEWEYVTNIGMIHTFVSLIPSQNYFLIKNVQSDGNNNYDNIYVVNNSIGKPYKIVLRYVGSSNENDLLIDDSGIHVPYYGIFGTISDFTSTVDYPNADKISPVTIQTSYHEGGANEDSYVSVTFDGNTYSYLKANPNSINIPNMVYQFLTGDNAYAGIASEYEGTTLVYFNTNNGILNPESTTNSLVLVSSVIVTMLKLMTYTYPYSIIPIELQLLLIGPQEFGILIGMAIFIREG
jgi:hypothetical protein